MDISDVEMQSDTEWAKRLEKVAVCVGESSGRDQKKKFNAISEWDCMWYVGTVHLFQFPTA